MVRWGRLLCTVIAVAAPFALGGCALDASGDSGTDSTHGESLGLAADGTGSNDNGAKGTPPPPPPQPEPSPWHTLSPHFEPEPSPWGGAQRSGTSAGTSGGAADRANVEPVIRLRELQVDQLGK